MSNISTPGLLNPYWDYIEAIMLNQSRAAYGKNQQSLAVRKNVQHHVSFNSFTVGDE